MTALYELVPAGVQPPTRDVDPLKYQAPVAATPAAHSGEVMTFKLRYKDPESQTSKLMTLVVADDPSRFEQAGDDMKFAAAVASFGMILRDSPHKGIFELADVHRLARSALGADAQGYRAEFLRLVTAAEAVLPE